MGVKASHKLPISFIAVMVFSATSVNGKCVGNGPSLAAPEKEKRLGKERLQRQGMRQEKRETFVFFLGAWTIVRLWNMELEWGRILILF